MSAEKATTPKISFPDWDSSEPTESLNQVYHWTIQNVEDQINWYVRKKIPKRLWSLSIRAVATLLATLGALCPLLIATNTKAFDQTGLAQWGYVLLALAASIIGADRYFGFSTGWMRYIVTQMSLEKALKEFRYDWAMLLGGQTTGAVNIPILIQKTKDFTIQVENLVRQETDAWVQEFQASLTQLEKILKTESEARRPGSIKVVVTNARDFDTVDILLNDIPVNRPLKGDTERILASIPPGRYEITAVGIKPGQANKKDTKVVEVQPNSMATLEITVP